MTQDTIFDSGDPQNKSDEEAKPQDPQGEAGEKGNQEESPAYDFIGEGKKYKSVDDALGSLPHKEEFIEQLKQENEQLRERVKEAGTVDDILSRIGQKPEEQEQPQGQGQEQGGEQESYQLSQDDIAKIVDSRISQKEQQQTAQQNISSVVNKMTELYGDKAEEIYNKRAEELNVPVEWLNETAAKSPNAVFELFGVGRKDRATPTKMTSSYNSEGLSQTSQKPPHKPIMWGASTDDVMSSWRSAKPQH